MTPQNPDFYRDPGSFRDPDGYVVHSGDRLLRVLSPTSFQALSQLEQSGLLQKLIASKQLIPTSWLSDQDPLNKHILSSAKPGSRIAEHKKLPFISYPAEWSFAMLADAALLTLDIQEQLAPQGFALKDASPYNVAFEGSQPVFIDASSIEQIGERGLWYALGQFQRMFLYPLLLAYHRGGDLKGYFLANIDGLSAEGVARQFGGLRFVHPGIFFDVTLPAMLSRAKPREGRPLPQGKVQAQLFQIRRFKRIIRHLKKKNRHLSSWVDYTETHSYADSAEKQKIEAIEGFLKEHHPLTVADLGCNTGTYSRIAARNGARILSIDNDHDAIDVLYQNISTTPEATAISPLWLELVNPTPGLGLFNRERAPFMDRAPSEAVFALALVHHLLVTARIPLDSMVELFAQLAKRWLIVEYVDTQDVMFRRLSAFKPDLYKDFNEATFLAAFGKVFTVRKRLPLDGETRTLFVMEKHPL